jgi:DNA-binding transcriptional ArsR family regulator
MDRRGEIEKALNHEMRRRILRWYARRGEPGSPKMISRDLEYPLENLSYHVRVLRETALLDEVGRAGKRNGIEHFYRLNPEARKLPVVAAILSFAG